MQFANSPGEGRASISLPGLHRLILDGEVRGADRIEEEGGESTLLTDRPDLIPFDLLRERLEAEYARCDDRAALATAGLIADLDPALCNPDRARVLLIEALVREKHDLARARALYQQALACSGGELQRVIRNNLAVLEFRSGALASSLELLAQAVEADPPLLPACLNFERIFANGGRPSAELRESGPVNGRGNQDPDRDGLWSRASERARALLEAAVDDESLVDQLGETPPVPEWSLATLLSPDQIPGRSDDPWVAVPTRSPSDAPQEADTVVEAPGPAPELSEVPDESLKAHVQAAAAGPEPDLGERLGAERVALDVVGALERADPPAVVEALMGCTPEAASSPWVRSVLPLIVALEARQWTPRRCRALGRCLRADLQGDESGLDEVDQVKIPTELEGLARCMENLLQSVATGRVLEAVREAIPWAESTLFAQEFVILVAKHELGPDGLGGTVERKLLGLLRETFATLRAGHWGLAAQKLAHFHRSSSASKSTHELQSSIEARFLRRVTEGREQVERGELGAAENGVLAIRASWGDHPMPATITDALRGLVQAIASERERLGRTPGSWFRPLKRGLAALVGRGQRPALVLGLVWLGLLLFSESSRAQCRGELLIDVSGSMSENDGDRLRWDGILTLAELLSLSRENSLGIRYFTDRDEIRVPHTMVDSATLPLFRAVAEEQPRSAGETVLVPAFSNATHELARMGERPFVIVVSDGLFGDHLEIGKLARRFASYGGSIYFLCIGPGGLNASGVNEALRAACLANDGAAFSIDTRKEDADATVLQAFLEMFVRVAPPSMTLLTDKAGHFSVNPSNRSFFALDPDGREIRIEAPGGMGDAGRNIRFKNWNVLGYERPESSEQLAHWTSDRWTVLSRETGKALQGVHVYLQNDVELIHADLSGITATAGVENELRVELEVEDLVTWFPGVDPQEFLDQVTVRYSITSRSGRLGSAAMLGELEPTGGQSFAGLLSPELDAGNYTIDFEVLHPDLSVGSVAHLEVPLVVHPSYLRLEALRIVDGKRQEMEASTKLYPGTEVQYEVQITRPEHVQADLDERFEIRRVEINLINPGGGDSAPYTLTRVPGDERLLFRSPVIALEGPGLHTGELELEGSLMTRGRRVLGGKRPSREEPLDAVVPLPGLSVDLNRVQASWDTNPGGRVAQERPEWILGLDFEGDPNAIANVVERLERLGLRFLISGEGHSADSVANPELFIIEPPQVTSETELLVRGSFLSDFPAGSYRLRADLGELLSEAPFQIENDETRAVFEGALIGVRVSTLRDSKEVPLAEDLVSERVVPATLFADQPLVLRVRPRKRLEDLGVTEYVASPSLRLSSAAGTTTYEASGSGVYQDFEALRLKPGRYELTILAEPHGGHLLRRRLELEVKAPPPMRLEVIDNGREFVWQHEVIDLQFRPKFSGGADLDWVAWSEGMLAEAWSTGDPEQPIQVKRLQDDALGVPHFGLRLPTDKPGEHGYGLRLTSRASTAELALRIETRPLFEIRVERDGRPIMSSTGGRGEGGHIRRPIDFLALPLVDDFDGVIESLALYTTLPDGQRALEWLPLTLGEAVRKPLDEIARELPQVVHVEGTGQDPETGAALRFEWSSPPLELRSVPWHATRGGRLTIAVASLLLIGLVVLWIRGRTHSLLPVPKGRIQWTSPDYKSEDFDLRSGGLRRFWNAGRNERRLRIGNRGNVSFGYPNNELGLGDGAHVDVFLASGRELGKEPGQYVCVQGTNGGGSTQVVVAGHLHALFPGTRRSELRLDTVEPPILLEVSAGDLSMHLTIELDRPTSASAARSTPRAS